MLNGARNGQCRREVVSHLLRTRTNASEWVLLCFHMFHAESMLRGHKVTAYGESSADGASDQPKRKRSWSMGRNLRSQATFLPFLYRQEGI